MIIRHLSFPQESFSSHISVLIDESDRIGSPPSLHDLLHRNISNHFENDRMEDAVSWVAEQKKEDIFEEIIYKSKKINLTHLRRVGWNGFPDRLRAPCWQLLLQYLPTSPSKQRSTIRRKRNEYHRRITKFYFEFDFCLTDRELPSSIPNNYKQSPPQKSPRKSKSIKSLSSRRDSFSKRTSATVGGSRKKIISSSKSSTLLPLFSQPCKEKRPPISAREDYLLLQIRRDINAMVDIPTKSAAKTKSFQYSKETLPINMQYSEINGSTKTTKNRLFSNSLVKASLERIIYLWSTHTANDKSSADYSSRYVPEVVDIVYPLFLTNLHGYIWDKHISTTRAMDKTVGGKPVDADKSQRSLQGLNIATNYIQEFEFDEVGLSSSEPTIYENEDRKSRIRKCEKLAIGIGIEAIPEEILEDVEADTYWCLENFMVAIQDYRYNDAFCNESYRTSNDIASISTGLQNMIVLVEKVLQRVDPVLYKYLKLKGVEYIWFTYRWLNSLHVRDMNETCILRLWDTCICEETDKVNGNYFSTFGFNAKRARKRLHLAGFLNFQVYICVALLHHLRDRILSQETFQDILFQLRNPPLDDWGHAEVELILSQAYVWSTSFHGSEQQIVQSASVDHDQNVFKTWAKRCHWPPRKAASRSLTSSDKILAVNPKTNINSKTHHEL